MPDRYPAVLHLVCRSYCHAGRQSHFQAIGTDARGRANGRFASSDPRHSIARDQCPLRGRPKITELVSVGRNDDGALEWARFLAIHAGRHVAGIEGRAIVSWAAALTRIGENRIRWMAGRSLRPDGGQLQALECARYP
jgi:hypothetical protein